MMLVEDASEDKDEDGFRDIQEFMIRTNLTWIIHSNSCKLFIKY